MRSSAHISSGVRRCGSQAQVPQGSGGFRKVPEGSARFPGVCWCRFRRQVPESSGRFRCVLVQVPEAVLEGFARL